MFCSRKRPTYLVASMVPVLQTMNRQQVIQAPQAVRRSTLATTIQCEKVVLNSSIKNNKFNIEETLEVCVDMAQCCVRARTSGQTDAGGYQTMIPDGITSLSD